MRIVVKKKNKYNAKKITYDGETFDSAKEAKRWSELRLMEAAGLITGLRRQVPFCLVPAQKGGIRSEKAVYYKADFVYMSRDLLGEEMIIEDVKGFRTPEYKIKRKLMKLYGHEITEV